MPVTTHTQLRKESAPEVFTVSQTALPVYTHVRTKTEHQTVLNEMCAYLTISLLFF